MIRTRLLCLTRCLGAVVCCGALACSACNWNDDRVAAQRSAPGRSRGLDAAFVLSGDSEEIVRDAAVAPDGSVYLTGGTASSDFPMTGGGFNHRFGGWHDVFVIKLDARGAAVWSTLIGGGGYDRAYAVEVGPDGSVYIGGRAGPGFPVTADAFQREFMGGKESPRYGPQDGFVCKLTQADGRPIFCSYFGGNDPAPVRDVAVHPSGDIFVASGQRGGEFPDVIKKALTNARHPAEEAVAARISADGSRIVWATYLGGSEWESVENSVQVDGTGTPYVLLTTESPDINTTEGAYDRTFAGNQDVYIAKLNPDTGAVIWATYFGGPKNESTETHELAVTPDGFTYVAIPTTSRELPVGAGAIQAQHGGGQNDIFVIKLSPDGTRLVASTFLGGSGHDRTEGVAVDAAGRICFTGTTTSANFPVSDSAPQKQLAGYRDAIAGILSPDLDRVVFATYLGGEGDEVGRAAAVAPSGVLAIGGQTDSISWLRSTTGRAVARGTNAFFMLFPPIDGAAGRTR